MSSDLREKFWKEYREYRQTLFKSEYRIKPYNGINPCNEISLPTVYVVRFPYKKKKVNWQKEGF